MDKIEQRLHAHFAHFQETGAAPAPEPSDTVPRISLPADVMRAEPTPTPSSSAGLEETPFAKVNSVASGSPAAQAGLKAGDKIRNFGSVNWMDHENLTKIAQTVQQNEGVSFNQPFLHSIVEGCTAILTDCHREFYRSRSRVPMSLARAQRISACS